MIVLTQGQADAVRGQGVNGAELRPLQYNGRWLLPEAVLSDPDYIEQREFLLSLPTEDMTIAVSDS